MKLGLKRKISLGLLLLGVFIIASIVGVFRFEVDIAMIIWAFVALAGIYSIYLVVSYILAPKKQVTIITKVELSSPPRLLRSVQNYRLKVSAEKQIEEKGIERTVKMDELIMSFNSKDHPDAYAYCMQIIGHHMESCIASAREAHPEAEVHGSPLLLPPAVKELKAHQT